MTPHVEVGPETTISLVDPNCWSTNLLMCMEEFYRTICCFSSFESRNLLIRVYPWIYILYGRPILLTTWCDTVTICWFWCILESTFCTADPFRWQPGVTLSPLVDSDLSLNQNSVRWTHFVDPTHFVVIQYTEDIIIPGKQKGKLKLYKVNFERTQNF